MRYTASCGQSVREDHLERLVGSESRWWNSQSPYLQEIYEPEGVCEAN